MTTTTTRPIDFINTSHDEVEKLLLEGKTPREVADFLQEPIPNVMGVWGQLRDTGKVKAQNFPTPPASAPPRHITNPDVAQRIAGATDLLVRAASIDDKRIQGALGRARKAMTDLAGLVANYDDKAAARNRIARLEAELRVARAELRRDTGTGASPDNRGGGSGLGTCATRHRRDPRMGQDTRPRRPGPRRAPQNGDCRLRRSAPGR